MRFYLLAMLISMNLSGIAKAAETDCHLQSIGGSELLHVQIDCRTLQVEFQKHGHPVVGPRGSYDLSLSLSMRSDQFVRFFFKNHGVNQLELIGADVHSGQSQQTAFSPEDKSLLQSALNSVRESSRENESLEAQKHLLQMPLELVNELIPAGLPLEDLNRSANVTSAQFLAPVTAKRSICSQGSRGTSWTPICQSIGKLRTATYDIANRDVQKRVRVGTAADRCRGRCGVGCGGPNGKRKYTQECLNHDICVDDFNETVRRGIPWLGGACANEFFAAAAGFLNGPNCP